MITLQEIDKTLMFWDCISYAKTPTLLERCKQKKDDILWTIGERFDCKDIIKNLPNCPIELQSDLEYCGVFKQPEIKIVMKEVVGMDYSWVLWHELGHLIDFHLHPKKYQRFCWTYNWNFELNRSVEILSCLLESYYMKINKLSIDGNHGIVTNPEEKINRCYFKLIETRYKTERWLVNEIKQYLREGRII